MTHRCNTALRSARTSLSFACSCLSTSTVASSCRQPNLRLESAGICILRPMSKGYTAYVAPYAGTVWVVRRAIAFAG